MSDVVAAAFGVVEREHQSAPGISLALGRVLPVLDGRGGNPAQQPDARLLDRVGLRITLGAQQFAQGAPLRVAKRAGADRNGFVLRGEIEEAGAAQPFRQRAREQAAKNLAKALPFGFALGFADPQQVRMRPQHELLRRQRFDEMRDFPAQPFGDAGRPDHELGDAHHVGDLFLPALVTDVETRGPERGQSFAGPADGDHRADLAHLPGQRLFGVGERDQAEQDFRQRRRRQLGVERERAQIKDRMPAGGPPQLVLRTARISAPRLAQEMVAHAGEDSDDQDDPGDRHGRRWRQHCADDRDAASDHDIGRQGDRALQRPAFRRFDAGVGERGQQRFAPSRIFGRARAFGHRRQHDLGLGQEEVDEADQERDDENDERGEKSPVEVKRVHLPVKLVRHHARGADEAETAEDETEIVGAAREDPDARRDHHDGEHHRRSHEIAFDDAGADESREHPEQQEELVAARQDQHAADGGAPNVARILRQKRHAYRGAGSLRVPANSPACPRRQ